MKAKTILRTACLASVFVLPFLWKWVYESLSGEKVNSFGSIVLMAASAIIALFALIIVENSDIIDKH